MRITETWIQLLDPMVMIIACLLIFLGYKKGFLSKLLSCLSFVVVVLISWHLSPMLARTFHLLPTSFAPYQDTPLAEFFYLYANQIFIFVIFIVIASISIFVLKPIFLLIGKLPVISFTDSLLGALFGVVEVILLLFASLLILKMPFVVNGNEVIEKTMFKYVENVQNKLFVIGSDLLFDFDMMKDEESNVSLDELKWFLREHGINDEMIQSFIEALGK